MLMNILIATNDGFVCPSRVLLTSLLATHDESVRFVVYILCSELKEESIEALNTLKNDRMDIHYLKVPDELFVNVPLYAYFSKEVYYRLVAHTLLPDDVKRILWLDGDMIVKKSIQDFYNQDMGTALLAACEDMENGCNEQIHEKFGIPKNVLYFSSGVMLLNLPEMREKMDVEQIFKFISDNREKIEIVDQDVLNAMFWKEVKVIPGGFRYNYFAARVGVMDHTQVMNDIAILHYCGGLKPWKEGYKHYGFEEFWKYAGKMPEYAGLYDELAKSHRSAHRKWVLYEKTKYYVTRVIPIEKLRKLKTIGRK